MSTLIQLEEVVKLYGTGNRKIKAVQGANFTIQKGETFGLVGESGSGKSTIGKMLIGLETISSGKISYLGNSLWNKQRFQSPRAGEIQIVFQDPQSSLNPRMTVKDIILEPLLALSNKERREKNTVEKLHALIQKVGLKIEHLARFPHEFSGGQRQRIAIARALITDPAFLILDEPTSALDVSIQAQVLNLLKELKQEHQLTYLFISHNMSVIRYMCDRIAVMYNGKIVEIGPANSLFEAPKHPYTKILLSSLPSVYEQTKQEKTISFAPHTSSKNTQSCIFYEKCPLRQELCLQAPIFEEQESNWHVACHVPA